MTIRTQTPFQYMKNFKAVAADWEYFSSLSDEGQLYCLSEQQVYVILVQLEYVGWLTRWYNTEDINQTTVDRVKSDLMEALMSCVDVSILVDQAAENLITAVTNRAIQSQTLRDAYAEEYTGDPTSINPSAPTTTWSYSDTGDGNAALCAALMGFVYQFARSQADSVRAGQIGGLAAISLIALLLIPGLNIFFVVGAAIAVLAGLGTVGVTTEIAIQALTDTAALDAVVCCMKANLKDAAVSQATWDASLGSCAFEVGSHEQIVSDFLAATLSSNYLTFLDFMGTGYDAVTTDVATPECPDCPEPPDVCDGGTLIDWRLGEDSWLGYGSTYHSGEGWGVDVVYFPTRIRVVKDYTPRPTSGRVWMSHFGYGVFIYNEQSGVGIGPLVGTFEYEGEDDIGFRYYASVIEAYDYRTFIEVQSGSTIPDDVRIIQACFDPDE